MTNLTCFWHPKMGYHDLSLDDECGECGRAMGHPLTHLPTNTLNGFAVGGSIDRGYYSATYEAQGALGQKVCLKVIPRAIYEMRGKDFLAECKQHAEVASGTQHLVGIRDAFDADVWFEGEPDSLACHVAVLDYVGGRSLRNILEQPELLSARTTAQIALDLLRLLQELERKQVFHNDLHDANILIEELSRDVERGAEAIDPFTRAVAVDLGSVRDASRSDEAAQTADSHQVTGHLMQLALRVLPDPMTAPDIDYRLALALNDIADLLKPDILTQRSPNFDDLISSIKSAFIAAASPWKKPADGLTRFGDSFNAQTMRPWFVPRLLVDPQGEWQRRIESSGPLVITGMRGCGKTMLLRALQFHARASRISVDEETEIPAEGILGELRSDGYVGLYVSCNRLLDGLGKPDSEVHEPYARLFLCYAREALQALRHLREIAGRESISPVAPRPIATVVSSLVANSEVDGSENIQVLERKIHEMLRSLASGFSTYRLTSHPATAMPSLAAAITECAEVWADARVLFLLDDVSTRHLNEESIRKLISTLMFAHESCAFKVTTEAQTLELVLKSPGLVEEARIGRDYDAFDLASAIYEKLRSPGGHAGRDFVAEVLRQRAILSASHPSWQPLEIMGDQPLVKIARRIASSRDSSPDRKNVYFGMSALASVCVGDIGDVISIYELVLSKAGRIDSVPVHAKYQSSAFQEFCSRRLYHLSRRQGRLKQFADGFAGAAHDLLVQSAKRTPNRIRDYASIYVRVTTGDTDRQFQQLRELMDAGVFVLTGGPDKPRTKTRDSDPVAQYTLTFRKLLGLSSAIGLSQRDRFELSGQRLIEWLEHPEESSDLLKRNLAAEVGRDDQDDALAENQADEGELTLFDELSDGAVTADDARSIGVPHPVQSPSTSLPSPTISEVELTELVALQPHTLITGRGFEERTLASTRRILDSFVPQRTVLVTYPLDGFGLEITERLRETETKVETVASGDRLSLPLADPGGLGVVDTTGLSKPFIYDAVRALLRRDGRVVVVHTDAEHHYPLNEDVEARLSAAPTDDYAMLEACHDILTGEKRPYHFVPLHHDDVDDGRRRVLFASSSAKHERLFSLLWEREFDQVEILVPPENSPRARLARLAARVAARDFHSCEMREVASDNPEAALLAVCNAYKEFYALSNCNFEVGMTGSKLHAVAIAAASCALKFSQVWYVRPDEFDTHRFTAGVGRTRVFLVVSGRD